MNKKLTAGLLVIMFLLGAGWSFKGYVFGGGFPAVAPCVPQTPRVVSVGPQSSVNIMNLTSGRAWASIQQVRTAGGIATSTVYLNLTASSTVNFGYALSTSSPQLILGMSTDLPFTGIVSAITSTGGSTTVAVTECR